jgi:hypothetical protein
MNATLVKIMVKRNAAKKRLKAISRLTTINFLKAVVNLIFQK